MGRFSGDGAHRGTAAAHDARRACRWRRRLPLLVGPGVAAHHGCSVVARWTRDGRYAGAPRAGEAVATQGAVPAAWPHPTPGGWLAAGANTGGMAQLSDSWTGVIGDYGRMAGYLVPGGDWWRGEARAVSFEAITRSGHFIKHGIGVILLCWRRVLRAMLIGGLLGVLVGELVASLMEWRFPPSLPAHVAALAFGLACGYGAGLTVLLDELLVGSLDTVKWLGGRAGAGVRAAAAIAGREAGELGSGVWRFASARAGGAPKRRPPPR